MSPRSDATPATSTAPMTADQLADRLCSAFVVQRQAERRGTTRVSAAGPKASGV